MLLACGGFDQRPLRTGVVRGQLLGSTPQYGRVSVYGDPARLSGVDADGGFTLEVPSGPHQLLSVASPTEAQLINVDVPPAGDLELGPLALPPAGYLDVEIAAANPESGELFVEGTPYAGISPDSTGNARIGPLGAGCYQVAAYVDLELYVVSSCVTEGNETIVRIDGGP